MFPVRSDHKNKTRRIRWVLSVLLLSLIFPIKEVEADIAPPKQPPGANLKTANEFTQVRMMEETVVITVLPETDLSKIGSAKVWAEFMMKNMGEESEVLLVRFPLSVNDGHFNFPEIDDFHVYVDNVMLETDPLQMPGDHGDTIQWVHFEVEFPPGEIVELEVDYTLDGTGEYPFVAYYYLLETGAGWFDTIGSGDVIIKLPFPANEKTIFINTSPGWGGTTTGAVLEDNQVSWHFEDLEPTNADNISISMVWPSAWHKVELERQKVASNPNDGEAWGRLGKIYKELGKQRKTFREDPGGEALFLLSQEAYEKALELLPEDALWHLGLGDLLCWKHDWYIVEFNEENRAGYIRGLEELATAYSLDPDNPQINDLILDRYYFDEMISQDEDGFVFNWLTQTPTLPPADWNMIPSSTPEHEEVVSSPSGLVTGEMKAATPGPEDSSSRDTHGSKEKSRIPICGSLVLFPLMVLLPLAIPLFKDQD